MAESTVIGQHSREEILGLLANVDIAAVATSAGENLRLRMMHYAVDGEFNIYLSTMKRDPKTVQLTNYPSISILAVDRKGDINDSREVEITGKAVFVHDEKERERALEMLAARSPVVKYLTDSGNGGMLDCIKVVPDILKYRVFKEIVQGMPPTVIEFPRDKSTVSDWQLIKQQIRNWGLAVRIAFLTASIVPVLLGTAIAWFQSGKLNWQFFLLTLIAGVAIQAGTNVLNDYADHRSGNDEVNREFVRPFSGGSRVIQLGLLTPANMLAGGLALCIISAVIGFYLAWASGPLILLLGAIGLLSGVFYAGKPFAWVNRGIGEVLVGLNFGVLMTTGAYYVQARSFSWLPVVAAIPVALLIAAVLYINEFPDYAADKRVGKKTLVVRLGRQKAVALYTMIVAGAYLAIVIGVVVGELPAATLLGLVTLPLAIRAVIYARKHHSSSFDLIPANAMTIISHLTTGLILTLAFVWQVPETEAPAYAGILGIVFAGFVFWMYRHIENQKNVFLGLKQTIR